MNLADLRAFMGNLLDYDPTNVTYTNQLTDLLNDAQTRILTDRPWSFSIVEEDVETRTDVAVSLACANGSSQATGTGSRSRRRPSGRARPSTALQCASTGESTKSHTS